MVKSFLCPTKEIFKCMEMVGSDSELMKRLPHVSHKSSGLLLEPFQNISQVM